MGASKILIFSEFLLVFSWSKLSKICLEKLSFFFEFAQFCLYFAEIARIYWNSPISPLLEAQNRGISAIGDISPAQIFHRQREAQNRGFGDISPDLLTLLFDHPEPDPNKIPEPNLHPKTKFKP